MNSTLKRRISRLEQEARSQPVELVECELSDEGKNLLRDALTGLMAPDEIEAVVNERRRVPHCHVASLSPVEREQRLLAIRQRVADKPESRALIDQALERERARSIVQPLSPESNAILDEARAMLETSTAP